MSSNEHFCLGCMSYLENPDALCPNCGWLKSMKNNISQLQAGYILTNENQTEKYIIGRALGQGGFGISYLAWNTLREERVVVKEYFPAVLVTRDNSSNNVMPIDDKDTAQFRHGLDNFLKEALNMLEFSNDPNVVNVKNFFQANQTAYIVMEFIDGQTFRQFIEQNGGRLPLESVLSTLAPIAAVLERMHKPKTTGTGKILRQPLIHRDISPDNIMFTRNGIVKLLDFGATRSFEGNKSEIVRAGYSPPEQFIIGDANFIQGSWTDVYALAATIYHALTGQAPITSISRLGSVSDSLVLPSSLGVKLKPFQEQALIKGLSPDYRKRYQTISDFMNSLRVNSISDNLMNSLRPTNDAQLKDEHNLIFSIVLSIVGGLIDVALCVFALNVLIEDSLLELDFIISFLVAIVSALCLGVFVWELLQIYNGQRPKLLNYESRLNVSFFAQIVCAIIFLFFAFTYTEYWAESLIAELQLYVFLNLNLYSDEADALVSMVILLYALVSTSGVWLGRQILRKSI